METRGSIKLRGFRTVLAKQRHTPSDAAPRVTLSARDLLQIIQQTVGRIFAAAARAGGAVKSGRASNQSRSR